jgi:hypothetical protein
MPLSPRTLRPASSGFNPRQISGLSLWLDGADSSSLYTTDAGPVSAVSSPTEIGGCALWLDGADSSAASMTLNGSLVETWKDKSGNGRDFTATGTARPTLTATAINSRSAVTFNGSSTTMTGNTAAQDVIRNLAGYTVFKVLRTATVAVGERFAFGVGITVLFRSGQTDSRSSIGGRRVGGDTLESVIGTSGELTAGAAFVQSAVVNHTAQSLTGLRNGTTYAADTTYMAAGVSDNVASSVSVGTQAGGTFGFWNGEIAEIVVFNTALSTTDRSRVEAYLAAKWGISGVHAQATATSDPVGYWGDKSGNARHATQATAGSRPLVASENSRTALSFDNSNDFLGLSSNVATANGGTLFIVHRRQSNSGGGLHNFTGVTGGVVAQQNHHPTGTEFYDGFASSSRRGWAQTYTSTRRLYSITSSGSSWRAFLDGAQTFSVGSNTPANNDPDRPQGFGAGGVRASTGIAGPSHAVICECLLYNSALTDSQHTAVSRYLANRWGITLAPQVSNADAQNWIDRVYANGGTVSDSTAAAVNQFCVDIEAASIRDRFYRLNLLCGTGLNACLVPLYRGPSLGGTQYGGEVDTNAGPFVSGDYTESIGLSRLTAQAKRLDTGLPTSALPSGVISSGHMAVWHGPLTGSFAATGDSDPAMIGTANGVTDRAWLQLSFRTATNGNASGRWGKTIAASESTGPIGLSQGSAFLMVQRTSDTNVELWRNASIVGTTATSATGIAGITHNILVFGFNNTGTPSGEQNAVVMRGYSVGDDMTSTQVNAYRNAWATFNTALGRTA